MARWELGTSDAAEVAELTDSELLSRCKWTRNAPPELSAAAKQGDPTAFLTTWFAVLPAGTVPEVWMTCWSVGTWAETSVLIKQMFAPSATNGRAPTPATLRQQWLTQLQQWWDTTGAETEWSPLETLLVLEAWPLIATSRRKEWVWNVWRRLLREALVTHDVESISESSSEQRLVAWGELPWRLGAFFASMKGSERLRKRGAEQLEHELAELTDENGAPLAEVLPVLAQWLAPLARTTLISKRSEVPLWDADAAELWQSTVEHVAPLIRADGQFVFAQNPIAEPRPFLETVLVQSGWVAGASALQAVFPAIKRRSGRPSAENIIPRTQRAANTTTRNMTDGLCMAPVGQSDNAGWGVLRTSWAATSSLAVIAHVGREPACYVQALGEPLLEGMWRSRILRNGKTQPVAGEWSCVCWQTDPVGDYFEMQVPLVGGGHVERQIFVSREDHFCVLAEAVSGVPRGRFDYEMRLPLVPGWSRVAERTTRDVRLHKDGQIVRVFPLTLPAYRVDGTHSEFEVESQSIHLKQAIEGTGWYGPLVLDWSPERTDAPAQWRGLTVSEEGRVVPPDQGAAYRLKVGSSQWLIYRALARSEEARCFLGHQTRYEMVLGSVDQKGDVTPLMQIQ